MKAATLVWIDLEMTGLNPVTDTILEIAVIITDNSLQLIKEGPTLTIHCDDVRLEKMVPEVRTMHMKSGLLERVRASTITVMQAQDQILAFLKEYALPQSPLCGNSVWADKIFLTKEMPEIIRFLHYRIIDVSSVKELVLRWYENDPDAQFVKAKTHRALDDIRESIAELKHYRRYFFV